MNILTKYAAIAMVSAFTSGMALAQDIGPIATGFASAVAMAEPLDTQTGLKQPPIEGQYGTNSSIGAILAAVSEDMARDLDAFIARQLATPGAATGHPEDQVVSAY